jgi:hypothetical protein
MTNHPQPDGTPATITFVTVGGRTSAVVAELQKMPGAGTGTGTAIKPPSKAKVKVEAKLKTTKSPKAATKAPTKKRRKVGVAGSQRLRETRMLTVSPRARARASCRNPSQSPCRKKKRKRNKSPLCVFLHAPSAPPPSLVRSVRGGKRRRMEFELEVEVGGRWWLCFGAVYNNPHVCALSHVR